MTPQRSCRTLDSLRARVALCKELTLAERTLILESLPPLTATGAKRARAAYRDDSFAVRGCDRCGKPYRGPGLLCSIECALAEGDR
jgi:hypothetical protein